MPRAALSAAIVLAAAGLATAASPHLDPSLMLAGCASCHAGHGASGSPMLPSGQTELCLSCHGSENDVQRRIAEGVLAAGAAPPLLDTALAQPHRHRLDAAATSRFETQAVTCTSCHAPHRGLPPAGDTGPGRRKLSPLDPSRFEFQLCEGCHGGAGAATQDLLDISRLLSPENRSFHPVEAPAPDRSPSVRPELSGQYINCTDCHGNDDPAGARGPHGSSVEKLLVASYVRTDGSPESADTYALCYRCHNRAALLSGSGPFPEHRTHVVEERTACATCHNPHGSVTNRALIRFGEETTLGGVKPSSSGRLEFLSPGQGSGLCYLTCHGEDHDPKGYGAGAALIGRTGEPVRVLSTRPPRRPVARPPRR